MKVFFGFNDMEIIAFPYNDSDKITKNLGYLFAHYNV